MSNMELKCPHCQKQVEISSDNLESRRECPLCQNDIYIHQENRVKEDPLSTIQKNVESEIDHDLDSLSSNEDLLPQHYFCKNKRLKEFPAFLYSHPKLIATILLITAVIIASAIYGISFSLTQDNPEDTDKNATNKESEFDVLKKLPKSELWNQLNRYAGSFKNSQSDKERKHFYEMAYKSTRLQKDSSGFLTRFLQFFPDGPETGNAEKRLFVALKSNPNYIEQGYLGVFPFSWYRKQASALEVLEAQRRFYTIASSKSLGKKKKLFWYRKYLKEFPEGADVAQVRTFVNNKEEQ